MKVLIVSNLYPPHYVGGYELRCSQVAEWLQRAGHEVRVLTSSYKLPSTTIPAVGNEPERVNGVLVERSLTYYPCSRAPRLLYAPRMARRQIDDAMRFLQLVREFQPDVVNWWNLEGLTKAILPIPNMQGIADACCLEDVWLIREFGVSGEKENLCWFRFWRGEWGPAFLRPLVQLFVNRWQKQVEGKGIPTYPRAGVPQHACYVSKFMRSEYTSAGVKMSSSQVTYGGISPQEFYSQRKAPRGRDRLRILYAGYVEKNRGLHVVIEALGLLPQELLQKVHLSVVASGPPRPTEYTARIHEQIRELNLSQKVTFWGKRNHDQMPQVYWEHDLLIQASVRPEGLPLTMMEALCAGCAVATTGSGGAMEIADAVGLPIFPKHDPAALSRLLGQLAESPELVSEIARRGQQVVLERFTFDRMMSEFSQMLNRLRGRKTCDPENMEPASTDLADHSLAEELGR